MPFAPLPLWTNIPGSNNMPPIGHMDLQALTVGRKKILREEAPRNSSTALIWFILLSGMGHHRKPTLDSADSKIYCVTGGDSARNP